MLKPFLFRREKGHVEKKVPPKEEIIVDVELTAPQKQYYRALYEQRTEFLHSQVPRMDPLSRTWRWSFVNVVTTFSH